MAILKVARLGNPVLRTPARPVPAEAVGRPDFHRFIDDMVVSMREYHGAGLAAVQVHESVQAAVLEVVDKPVTPAGRPRSCPLSSNPEIVSLGDETEDDWDGCLSIPEVRGRVPRYKRLRVTAQRHAIKMQTSSYQPPKG